MSVQFIRERKGLVMEVIAPDDTLLSESIPQDDAVDTRDQYHGPSPYHVNYCGYEHCYPGYTFGPHTRTSYLLHIVAEGRGEYIVGDKIHKIKKGQIFLIYPSVTTTYRSDEEDPWSYYWIGFSGYQSEFILSQMGFSRDNLVISVDAPEPLLACIDRMMDTHEVTFSNELYRTAELLRFFSYVISAGSAHDSPTGKKARTMYARLAMRYLSGNFDRKLSISALAAHIGVDRSYLTKSFQAEYGYSPQQYVMDLRMKKAKHLLEESEEPIASVAAKCGYSDALAFSRLFRKTWGCSPSAYRASAAKVSHAAQPDADG